MLHEGMKAPDFSLPDQHNQIKTLSQFQGKWVVLYFYPKDLTPGCTTEACNFQASLPDFSGIDAVILGVSKDSVASHLKFAKKYDLKFQLLSDEAGSVCESYGTWQSKKMYGKEYMGIVRSTFLINPQGNIEKIYPKVDVKTHQTELLADIKKLIDAV